MLLHLFGIQIFKTIVYTAFMSGLLTKYFQDDLFATLLDQAHSMH